MGDAVDKILNQAALEALYSATYVDNFLDTVENLPNDVQREISVMRELDIRYQALLHEMDTLRGQLEAECDAGAVKRIMVMLQDKLILSQEIGDDKLQIVQHILDIVENRQRQLELDSRNLDFGQDPEKSDICKDAQPDRSCKRARRARVSLPPDVPSVNVTINEMSMPDEVPSLPVGDLRQNLNTNASTSVSNSNIKQNASSVQKKALKRKKRRSKVDREVDSPTEIPIDPDEPTYCLCEQVSYGEMIGCDNDLCPIEWFHFSCVSLTNKPKGKWFCPKCRGDKPTVMKPRAQFLKELEKYNKEKEEKL